jgi:hypothetical protein
MMLRLNVLLLLCLHHQDSILLGMSLLDTILLSMDLLETSLPGVNLLDTDLRDAKLQGAILRGIMARVGPRARKTGLQTPAVIARTKNEVYESRREKAGCIRI